MKLRVGLIGIGDAWATRHRPALRALSDRFQVTAVCSAVYQLAQSTAQEFNADAVDGFQVLAARPDVDAVLLLERQWYGPLPILAACAAGKAVYCTDILGIDGGRAQEIIQRVDHSGVAFMAEMPRRLAAATLRLKELIATCLGPVHLLYCHERARPCVPGKANGGLQAAMTRDMMELVDWCRYVVGQEPKSLISARHGRKGISGPTQQGVDYQMISLDFSPDDSPGTGPLAQISWGNYLRPSWPEAAAFRPPAAMQVCCQNGVAFIDLPATVIWFDEAGRHRESLDGERPVGEQLLTQFHRAVTSFVRKRSDLEDAHRALQIVSAALESCQQGRRVSL